MKERHIKIESVLLLVMFVCVFTLSTCVEAGIEPDPTVESISITNPPAKTDYLEGERFSKTGMIVTAYYNNKTSAVVTDYTVSPWAGLSVSDTVVTIRYEGKQTTVNITVTPQPLSALENILVTTPPNKTIYYEGEFFSPEGMIVTAYFGGFIEAAITNYTVLQTEPLDLDTDYITIKYGDKEAVVNIIVNPLPPLVGIEITNPPDKTEYGAGEKFSTEGMVVTANYGNGIFIVVTNYTVTPSGGLKLDVTFVTISLGDATATVDVTVDGTYDYFSNEFDESECSFFDKFDGDSLDLTKWGYQNGNGSEYGLGGWGNGERQSYRTPNVEVKDGMLRLVAKREAAQVNGRSYTSGKLVTAKSQGNTSLGEPAAGAGQKFVQTYGRFEAKIRLTKATKGAWPAFWMMPNNTSYGGWPRSGEIDIMEMIGTEPSKASSTIHSANSGGGQRYRGSNQWFPETSTIEEWHVYGIKWTPDEFIMLIDGYQFYRMTRSNWTSSFYNSWPSNPSAPFDRDFYMILNLALDSGQFNGASSGNLVDSDFPIAMEVDWIRCYTLENDPWEIQTDFPGRTQSYNN